MENILYINACVRQNSRTDKLAKYLLSKYNQNFDELVLKDENILPLNEKTLSMRDTFISVKNFNDEMFKYAKQFSKADIVVIAAPYWDLSFPALLKTYIEMINVSGITFKYSEKGNPESLCKAKELIYITTSGGKIFSDDFGFGYVKTVANTFYGIDNIKYYSAEGLDIIGADIENILNNTKEKIDNDF